MVVMVIHALRTRVCLHIQCLFRLHHPNYLAPNFHDDLWLRLSDSNAGFSLPAAVVSAFMYLFGAFLIIFADKDKPAVSHPTRSTLTRRSERTPLSYRSRNMESATRQSIVIGQSAASRESNVGTSTQSGARRICRGFNKFWLITCGCRCRFSEISTIRFVFSCYPPFVGICLRLC